MKLWIDLQGAQTESRFRGIGRYTVSFVRALAAAAGQHEIGYVVNSALVDHSQALVAELTAGTGPRVAIFDPGGRVAQQYADNDHRARVAELVREAFIADLRPDVVLVSSLVEGWLDDAVTSIGAFEPSLPTASTFYDAIPLLHSDD